jgi:protein-S-isoprenylcysteine O-methyltransferase Ste14
MTKFFIFATITAFLVYVSRRSLLRPRTHGFYRFFAWECILGLILLNFAHWEVDPLSPHQLISWLLLMFSIFLVIHGIRLLQIVGKPDEHRPDSELLAFEKTTNLVTVGVYKYIRHPLYASLLFLAWGVYLKDTSASGLLLVCTASFFLLITAKRDEIECVQHFGSAYTAYMQRTKMFIPFVI